MRTTIDHIGKYELRARLARTPTSTVYDAWDTVIARRVALKLMPLSTVDDFDEQEAFSRFKRGAQAAGQLNHPNIVSVYDYGETDSYAYLVMEFVGGSTLKDVFDTNQRFALPEICRIIESVLDALQYSHDRGVVHRDVKPANIMFTEEKQVKITDFGIARLEDSQITQAGMVIGTPAYMSPEQFLGENVDWRTDIYSTGVVLYQMLIGERPYEGNLATIMHKVLYGSPLLPSRVSTLVTPALDAIVTKAMARNREDRFKSAAEFSAALQAGALPPTPNARKPAATSPRTDSQTRPYRAKSSKPGVAVLAVASVLTATLAVGGYYAYLRSSPQGSSSTQQAADAARLQQQTQARIRAEQERQQQEQAQHDQEAVARQQQQAAQLQREQEDRRRQQQALQQQQQEEKEARQQQEAQLLQQEQERRQRDAQRQEELQARRQQELARLQQQQQEQARLRQQQQEVERQKREAARQEQERTVLSQDQARQKAAQEQNRSVQEQRGTKKKQPDGDAVAGGKPNPSFPVTSTNGAIGLLCVSVTADSADRFGLRTPEGMIVTGVVSGGAAERAGIRLDDIILKMKGSEISDLSLLPKVIGDVPPGQTVPVEIIRNGSRRVVQLSLDTSHR